MGAHYKIWKQEIPISLEKAWIYFSRPENLNAITPTDFKIHFTKDISKEEIHKDMEISYILAPIFGIPLKWTTKITDYDKPNYFIYEQKKGPYDYWVHEHYFEESGEGVQMIDKLTYALRWGFIGDWLNKLFIAQRIDHIFEYRREKIKSIFGGS